MAAGQPVGNRLAYLDENDPFYPHAGFPKLATPQWVGEGGVEAVVVLAIDDMRQHEKYETMLRPILERLKQIDGRAPVSILCNTIDPAQPHLQRWLQEGLSLEAHTMTHPCPLLARSNWVAAARTYHDCVDLLHQVPGSTPVAFRMPCCDSINSPSPRFYASLFNGTSRAGHFLGIDSSIMNIFTDQDPELPREWVTDADGRPKFRKYLPFPSFVTTIQNYPYPYVLGKLCWEFPAMVPSDWEAQHVHGTNNPVTIADWQSALDATVAKQGTFTFIFHPHGWIRAEQMVQFIDYAVERYGPRVKFLNFREALERLNEHLLAGHPLRRADGQDNGVRLLDLNRDGYLDVIIGNPLRRLTRLWSPAERRWEETSFPTRLVERRTDGQMVDAGVKFGVMGSDGTPAMLVNAESRGGWRFEGRHWVEHNTLLAGLDLEGRALLTARDGADAGVRMRDVDQDGRCEFLVGNEAQNAVFQWFPEEESWKRLPYALPAGARFVDASGRDHGLRFADINEDGYDDIVFSNEQRYSLHLFVPKWFLGFQAGWSREVLAGRRGEAGEIPMIARRGENNGAWFHSRHLWVQNEDTAHLPDLVDRRSFDGLRGGLQPKPKSPEESLACVRVRPGFVVELVASEPLVRDPIAFEWGEDGKLWVVEMGDYPLGLDERGKPGGIVRFLEDLDGDGRYDRSTVFLEHLNFPTGVMPWRKGVLVSAAPEVFYAEDTDGDGKADLRQPLLTGFAEGNQQHRVNGFVLGLDNWIYGANGDSGGKVRVAGMTPPRPGAMPLTDSVELRGKDFRFKPDAGLLETVSAQTQFGRHRDDWGNWFANNNPAWLWHVVLPEDYLARNPNLLVKSVKKYLADYPNGTRVFAISRTLQRFNDIGMLHHVTSANSPTPYRDELFGDGFDSSVFISEPVHNLVHREVLTADGVTFASHRASDELESEFLASTDNWFRPIMLKTGPDGALYIADMYRLVLEHPEWIPQDTQRHLDLRAGADLGRIYRVYPQGAVLRAIPRLAGQSGEQLAASLESPNGWTRDTAQRLLLHSGGTAAVPVLSRLASHGPSPKTRVQALATLDGLGQLPLALILSALNDPHPAVREHGVRLSEAWLGPPQSDSGDSLQRRQLAERLLAMVDDPAIRVRFQLAFTLGNWENDQAGRALARLGIKDAGHSHLQTAVLSSALPHCATMLEMLVRERERAPVDLLQELLSLAVAGYGQRVLPAALREISRREGSRAEPWQFTVLAGFLNGVERRHGSLLEYRNGASGELRDALEGLKGLLEEARTAAFDSDAPAETRVLAVRLLGRGLTGAQRELASLAELLRPQIAPPVQQAAVATLARSQAPDVAALLLNAWRGYEPALRNEVISVLVTRPMWSEQLLETIERGAIPASQISPAHQQRLLSNSQEAIRTRAQRVFSVASNRRELVRQYGEALLGRGDPEKGKALFQMNCASCHRWKGEGTNVGPDLASLANRSPLALLIAILDPNQAVESAYVHYTAITHSDRELSGIIVAETPSSVTLRSSGGLEESILRADIRELSSSGLSLMPEGFEKTMSKAELSDLIAFLTSSE